MTKSDEIYFRNATKLCENKSAITYHTSSTPEKQLFVLQFSAHEALYVVVNVGQINMTKIIIISILIA